MGRADQKNFEKKTSGFDPFTPLLTPRRGPNPRSVGFAPTNSRQSPSALVAGICEWYVGPRNKNFRIFDCRGVEIED